MYSIMIFKIVYIEVKAFFFSSIEYLNEIFKYGFSQTPAQLNDELIIY